MVSGCQELEVGVTEKLVGQSYLSLVVIKTHSETDI